MKKYNKYINRTFYLAEKGLGYVLSNPLVGCVIVKNNEIIGEGFHQKYGEAHAEINAINSIKEKKKIQGSSIYINLEPCSHHGKTPPCVDSLIKFKPKEVIISNIDPNPSVNGRGIKKLRDNNIEVITGILEDYGKFLNRRFFYNHKKNLPYIILKWAETKDGFIARENGDSKWISNEMSRSYVHRWRSQEDGILVGVETANKDNPKLNVRNWNGNNPIRIILDPNSRLKENLNIHEGPNTTFIYNRRLQKEEGNVKFVKINSFDLDLILNDVYSKGISSILVEGGTKTINYFIEKNLWNEARIFKSNINFIKGIDSPKINTNKYEYHNILEDKLYIIQNNA